MTCSTKRIQRVSPQPHLSFDRVNTNRRQSQEQGIKMSLGEYSSSHQAFLQALLARPTFTFAEARPVLAAIFSIDSKATNRRSLFGT
jgi:Nse1 non-SMC component of SMC5-6 complex